MVFVIFRKGIRPIRKLFEFMKRYILVVVLFSIGLKINAQQNEKVAYFASGCFWCVESIFESVEGVRDAVSGYSGGEYKNPTYKKVAYGLTDHAEAVAVYYNPEVVSFEDLVSVYYDSHDPTTVNGQYPDFGTQYRSIAFYETEQEKEIIQNKINQLNKDVYNGKIATEVKQFVKFYKAEDYHQNFKKRNPNNSYIKAISIPRLIKFRKKTTIPLKN